MTALEMVMGKNRSADDRQVRVGAQEIVRELANKVKQLAESCMVDRHRRMLEVECDAVFVVIAIRAVLQAPLRIVDGYGDNAVVLTCRVSQSPRVALILRAEKAFRVIR